LVKTFAELLKKMFYDLISYFYASTACSLTLSSLFNDFRS